MASTLQPEPSAVVRALKESLPELAPRGLASAYLFGSYARSRPHRESDVDIGILLSRALDRRARFEFRVRLASLLPGRLGVRNVDVVVLNDAPPQFARRIVFDGIRVAQVDAETDHDFRRNVQLRAADLEPFLRRTRRIKLEAIGP
jgi:predicted nucleotidyltransferase